MEFHIDRIRICLEADLNAIPCLIASEYPLMVEVEVEVVDNLSKFSL